MGIGWVFSQQELTEGTEWKSITLLALLPPVKFFLLFFLSFFLLAPVAFAHEARPAYLEIKETAHGKFDLLWRTPVLA